MATTECGCSEDYGPCEDHCELMVGRDGASSRTADELALVLISDCIDLGATLSADDVAESERLRQALEGSSGWVGNWFDNPVDTESAHELAERATSALPAGLSVWQEDGYQIVRASADCPLFSE